MFKWKFVSRGLFWFLNATVTLLKKIWLQLFSRLFCYMPHLKVPNACKCVSNCTFLSEFLHSAVGCWPESSPVALSLGRSQAWLAVFTHRHENAVVCEIRRLAASWGKRVLRCCSHGDLRKHLLNPLTKLFLTKMKIQNDVCNLIRCPLRSSRKWSYQFSTWWILLWRTSDPHTLHSSRRTSYLLFAVFSKRYFLLAKKKRTRNVAGWGTNWGGLCTFLTLKI